MGKLSRFENSKKIRTLHLGLLGLGTVGRGLLQILQKKEAWLRSEKGLEVRLTGIATKNSHYFNASNSTDALGISEATERFTATNPTSAPPSATALRKAIQTLIANPLHDIIIEATPTIISAAPTEAFFHIECALKQGKHVVTANKGPIAERYHYLKDLATANDCRLMIEATVLSGTPVFNFYKKSLIGTTLNEIEGILNGTTNFIISKMEAGLSYETALHQAQAERIAETNPEYDVSGKDSMLKTIILANTLFKSKLSIADVPFTGITTLTKEAIQAARNNEKCYKLISRIKRQATGAIHASVSLEQIPLSHPLAGVKGTLNALAFNTEFLDTVTIIGAGAGQLTAAYGIFNDICTLSNSL